MKFSLFQLDSPLKYNFPHTATYMHEFERPKNVPFSRQIGGRRRQRTVEIENENISSLTIFN